MIIEPWNTSTEQELSRLNIWSKRRKIDSEITYRGVGSALFIDGTFGEASEVAMGAMMVLYLPIKNFPRVKLQLFSAVR